MRCCRRRISPSGRWPKRFKLVTSKARGKALLADALTDESDSSWPEAHYLGPLHPVIDWAADRAMASLGRNQVFAVRGDVDHPTVLLLGTLTNRRGQVVASSYLTAEFPNPANPGFCMVTPHESATAMAAAVGYAGTASNPGAVAGTDALRPLIAHAVRSAARRRWQPSSPPPRTRSPAGCEEWSRRATDWTEEADALIQRSELRQRRVSVEEEQAIAARMVPERQLVRPLLVVVPHRSPGRRPTRNSGRSEVMASSDALIVGEDWISEHYFTTDAKSESFQAKVTERRKAWDEDAKTGAGHRPLAVHRRPRPPGSVDRRPAGRPAGHRRRHLARAVRRPAPGPRLRAAASTS